MTIKLLLTAAASFFATLTLAASDEKPAGKAANFDKARLFAKMDADGDGKVTRAEFKKFREQAAEKLKDSGKAGKVGGKLGGKFAGKQGDLMDKVFDKIDANGDGQITKAEFEKFQPAGNLDADKRQKLKDLIKNKKGQ